MQRTEISGQLNGTAEKRPSKYRWLTFWHPHTGGSAGIPGIWYHGDASHIGPTDLWQAYVSTQGHFTPGLKSQLYSRA